MVQIITVQSASDTTESPSDEKSPKIEKIPESIFIKISFAIYDLITNRNAIICLVVILVIVGLAFKLTSMETFFRKKLQKDDSLNNVLISERSGFEYPIYQKEMLVYGQGGFSQSLENLTTDNAPKEQPLRYRSAPKRIKKK